MQCRTESGDWNVDVGMEERLRSGFRGAILGGALGDALGFPFEGCSRNYMRAIDDPFDKGPVSHRSGLYPTGQISENTQLTLATIDSVLAVGAIEGESLVAHFLPLWRDRLIVAASKSTDAAMERLLRGECQWHEAGSDVGCADNGAAKRAAPIGLWNFDDFETLVTDVRTASWVTHRDPSAMAGMAAVAAATAYAIAADDLLLGVFLDHIAGAVERFDDRLAEAIRNFPYLLSLSEDEALGQILSLGSRDPLDDSEEITNGVFPSVLCSLYYFLESPYDYRSTVGGCLRAGGGVNSTAAMAGAISGAFNGLEGIPENTRRSLPQGNEIVQKADAFFRLKKERLED